MRVPNVKEKCAREWTSFKDSCLGLMLEVGGALLCALKYLDEVQKRDLSSWN